MIAVRQDKQGKIFVVDIAGLQHILQRHGYSVGKLVGGEENIVDAVLDFVVNGKILGSEKPKKSSGQADLSMVYEWYVGSNLKQICITVANNGRIYGARLRDPEALIKPVNK